MLLMNEQSAKKMITVNEIKPLIKHYIERLNKQYQTDQAREHSHRGSLEELIDVNNPEDLEFAEIYAKGIKRKENLELQLIKHLASSPVLSDIMDDLKEETLGEYVVGHY